MAQNKTLASGIYYVGQKTDSSLTLSNSTDTVFINPTPIITLKDFKLVRVIKGDFGTYAIEIVLNESSAQKFEIATEKWIGKRLAMVVDGKLTMAPTVQSKITGGRLSISSSMTKAEAKEMKRLLEMEMKK